VIFFCISSSKAFLSARLERASRAMQDYRVDVMIVDMPPKDRLKFKDFSENLS
jgi:hypothetical protein